MLGLHVDLPREGISTMAGCQAGRQKTKIRADQESESGVGQPKAVSGLRTAK